MSKQICVDDSMGLSRKTMTLGEWSTMKECEGLSNLNKLCGCSLLCNLADTLSPLGVVLNVKPHPEGSLPKLLNPYILDHTQRAYCVIQAA